MYGTRLKSLWYSSQMTDDYAHRRASTAGVLMKETHTYQIQWRCCHWSFDTINIPLHIRILLYYAIYVLLLRIVHMCNSWIVCIRSQRSLECFFQVLHFLYISRSAQICEVAAVVFIPHRFSVEELFYGENFVVCEQKLSLTAIQVLAKQWFAFSLLVFFQSVSEQLFCMLFVSAEFQVLFDNNVARNRCWLELHLPRHDFPIFVHMN